MYSYTKVIDIFEGDHRRAKNVGVASFNIRENEDSGFIHSINIIFTTIDGQEFKFTCPFRFYEFLYDNCYQVFADEGKFLKDCISNIVSYIIY